MLKGNASRPDQKLKNTTISDFFTSKSNSVKRKRSTNQTGNELPISKKKIDEGSINNKEQTLQLTSSMMSEESLGSVTVLRECPVVSEEMAHSTTDSHSNNYSTDKNATLKVSTFDSSRLLSAQKEAEVIAMSTEITDDGIDSLIENVQQSSSGSPEFNVESKPATSSQVKEISRPRPCSPLLFDSSQVSTPDPESMEFQDEVSLPAIKEMGDLNKIPYCWETNPFNAKSETRHLKLYNTEHKGPGPPPSKSTT
uniref:Uncharacterized protein n=1 Tax=Ciona savignyi TaxID=51511 RepID=H2YY81_CIOSA